MGDRSDEAEFLKTLREASIRTAVQYLRVVQRLREGDPARARDRRDGAGAEPLPPPPGDFLFDVARLQLQGYSSLLDLTDRYADHFVGLLRARGRRRTPGGASRREGLRISAALQCTATAQFDVGNGTGAAAEVHLDVPRARRSDAAGTIDVPATFLPARIRLAAGEVHTFRILVFLDGRFQTGARYFTDIEVGMRGRVVERIPLEIAVVPALP
jgi:hypothetical protein